jgi:hypothetical protein
MKFSMEFHGNFMENSMKLNSMEFHGIFSGIS